MQTLSTEILVPVIITWNPPLEHALVKFPQHNVTIRCRSPDALAAWLGSTLLVVTPSTIVPTAEV
jgi:hypothetical protein